MWGLGLDNYNMAMAMSSSFVPGVAFKCLNQCHCNEWLEAFKCLNQDQCSDLLEAFKCSGQTDIRKDTVFYSIGYMYVDISNSFNASILFDSLFEYKSNNVEKKMDWTL